MRSITRTIGSGDTQSRQFFYRSVDLICAPSLTQENYAASPFASARQTSSPSLLFSLPSPAPAGLTRRQRASSRNPPLVKTIGGARTLSTTSSSLPLSLPSPAPAALTRHQRERSNPTAQENAIAALLNLSKHPNGKFLIFELGGLGKILKVLSTGLKMEAKRNATAVLFYLSSVERCRREIEEAPDAIPALVGLLRAGSDHGKKKAFVVLFGLVQFPGNH